MNPDPRVDDLPGHGGDIVRQAATQLRGRVDEHWAEVGDRVIARALAATRRSGVVRAQATSGPVWLAEHVLVAAVAAAVDAAVPDAAVTGVHLVVSGADTLTGVRLPVAARYGADLREAAAAVRAIARASLRELLGPPGDQARSVSVDVHVHDVVTGDPQAADARS